VKITAATTSQPTISGKENRVDDGIDDRRDGVAYRLVDAALRMGSRGHEGHAKTCQQDTFQHFL
jgi:hypothetical protein